MPLTVQLGVVGAGVGRVVVGEGGRDSGCGREAEEKERGSRGLGGGSVPFRVLTTKRESFLEHEKHTDPCWWRNDRLFRALLFPVG